VYVAAQSPKTDTVPIGQPLPGFDYRILDDSGRSIRNDGHIGELLLSGPQVVTGYWMDEDLTRSRFVRLEQENPQTIWYRTGDLVSYDSEHGLFFHGRCDHQVKIRGYRVELQEIEGVLRTVTGSDLV